jgi:hypothetical protein
MYVSGKMTTVETIPEMGVGRDKGELWKEWIQVWYIWNTVRIFVNATMYPYQAQWKNKNFKKET